MDTTETEKENEEDNESTLSYGEVIQIIASKNTSIHNHVYMIDYILDKQWIRCKDTVSLSMQEFRLDETTGSFRDQSIEEIHVLYHEPGGYAEKNGLIPFQWVDIWVGIDVPFTITGQITQIENDRIEVTRWPEKEIYFFDFEYKGLFLTPPLRFTLRDAPKQTNHSVDPTSEKKEASQEEEEVVDMEPREQLALELQQGEEEEVIFSDEVVTIAQWVELQEHERFLWMLN